MLIAQMCLAQPKFDSNACHKALEATMVQTKIQPNVHKLEQYTQNKVKTKITSYTGETIWIVTGVTYKVIKDKSFSYKFKTKMLPVDYIAPSINQESGSLQIGISW